MEDPLPPSYGTECRETLIMGKLRDSLLSHLAAFNPSISINSNHASFIERRIQELFNSFHTPTHPPYASMIQRAIMELNEETGSTKEAISEFILRDYEDLPWAHVGILDHHLGKLCLEGELLCTENGKYMVMADDGGKNNGEETKCKGTKKRKKGKRKKNYRGKETNRKLEKVQGIEEDNGLLDQEVNEQIQVSELNGVGTNDPSSVVDIARQDERTQEHGEAHQQLTERVQEQGKSDKQVLRVVELEQQCQSNWQGTGVTEEHTEAANNQGRIAVAQGEAEEPQIQWAIIEMNEKIVSCLVLNKEPYQTDVEQGLIIGKDIHYEEKQVLEDCFCGEEQQNGLHDGLNELCGQQIEVVQEQNDSENQNGEKQKLLEDHYGEEQQNGVCDGLNEFCGQQTEVIQEHNNESLLDKQNGEKQKLLEDHYGEEQQNGVYDGLNEFCGQQTEVIQEQNNESLLDKQNGEKQKLLEYHYGEEQQNGVYDGMNVFCGQQTEVIQEHINEVLLESHTHKQQIEVTTEVSGFGSGEKTADVNVSASLGGSNSVVVLEGNLQIFEPDKAVHSSLQPTPNLPVNLGLRSEEQLMVPNSEGSTECILSSEVELSPAELQLQTSSDVNLGKKSKMGASFSSVNEYELRQQHWKQESAKRKHSESSTSGDLDQPPFKSQCGGSMITFAERVPMSGDHTSNPPKHQCRGRPPKSKTVADYPILNKMEKQQQHDCVRIRGRGRGRPRKLNRNANQSEENLQPQDPRHGLASPQNSGQDDNRSLDEQQLQSQSQVQSEEGCLKLEPEVDKSSQKHQLLPQVKKRGRGRPPKTSTNAKQTQWQQLPTFQDWGPNEGLDLERPPKPSSDASQSHHELQAKPCEVQRLGLPKQKLIKPTAPDVDNILTSTNGVWDADSKDFVTPLSVSVASGYTLLRDPHLNKGLAFTEKERDAHYLHGLLPPTVISQDTQVKKMIQHICQYQVPSQKYMAMMDLQARNERLFYKLLIDHVEELLPVVYTPTVGEACQKYGSIFMHPQGLYISLKVKGRILEVLRNWPEKNIQVIVVTDGEWILGLGDLGCQSMGKAVGKLSLYTALGGIQPSACLPITIDVGTNNEKLLNDESYIGLKHRRATGQEYAEFLHEFMTAVKQNFGEKVLVQFEDFSNQNGYVLLEKYRSKHLVFNDNIQGTAPVVLAGLVAALKLVGGSLADHKFLFLGAEETGIGIAELIAWKTKKQTNAPLDEVRKNIWLVDSKGLIVSSRKSLQHFKKPWAHEHEPVKELVDAIKQLKPTVLIGTSGQGRSFTKEVIEAMAAINAKPIIFALSNPTSQSECTAEEAYTWSQGRVIFASGSPFDPVEYNGNVFVPGQANNAYIFPGFALGLIMSGANRVYDDLLLAAAEALAAQVTQVHFDKGFIYPPFTNIRNISAHIAASVAAKAYQLGVATHLPQPKDLVKFAKSYMYTPRL